MLAGTGSPSITHPCPERCRLPITTEELDRLLDGIRWKRRRRTDGVAAKANASGRLNFGGVKDSGGRVADAILYPATETGR
ncbi:hypothetical protein GCM10023238_03110 [Streptomyces heliomycini]